MVDLNKPDLNLQYPVDAVSTVPITCWHCVTMTPATRCSCCTNQCRFNYYIGTKLNNPGCELEVSNRFYDQSQPEFIAGSIKIQLNADAAVNQNQNYLITFAPFQDKFQCHDNIWDGYQIEPAVVSVDLLYYKFETIF